MIRFVRFRLSCKEHYQCIYIQRYRRSLGDRMLSSIFTWSELS